MFGITLEEAAIALQRYVPPPGRMRLFDGVKDSVILDDTYNASPVAVERALLTLSEVRTHARRVAVLGDMLELGRFSVESHEKVGALAAKSADILFTVGVRSRKIAEGALENGMGEDRIFQYDDADSAGRELQNMLQQGDVVLVKGSQGIRLERLVEEVMRRPEEAESTLVRQSKTWKQ